jgi:hypothetical protein
MVKIKITCSHNREIYNLKNVPHSPANPAGEAFHLAYTSGGLPVMAPGYLTPGERRRRYRQVHWPGPLSLAFGKQIYLLSK